MLGAHASTVDGRQGTHFGVWAPNARGVSVHGDFNAWSTESHPLTQHAESGVWEGFVPGLGSGTLYKYWVRGHEAPYAIAKADPFGFLHEEPPATGSIVCDLEYEWGDAGWMKRRGERQKLDRPDVRLRGPSGLVAASRRRVALLPRAGSAARRLRERPGPSLTSS